MNTTGENMQRARSVLPAIALIALCTVLWQLWVRPTLQIRIDSVTIPLQTQPLDDLQLKGSKQAQLGLVIFSDFQCPVCKTFAEDVLPAIVIKYVEAGRVLLAFSDVPLESIHPAAARRAAIAECAGRQGQFWQVHDRLFSMQASASVEQDSIAGLDGNALTACLSSGVDRVIGRRSATAAALGIRSTPSLFVGTVERTIEGARLRVTDALVGLRSVRQLSAILDRRLTGSE